MPATYGISTYGKTMLIDEGEEFKHQRPLIYNVYLAFNVLLFLGPTIGLTTKYLRIRESSSKTGKYLNKSVNSLWLITSVFISFVVNNAIRSSHMFDHMYRPVYYHEPIWAYQKYIVIEMELATYSNIFISLFGYLGLSKLMEGIATDQIGNGRVGLVGYNFLYIFGSLFNLVHYTMEPPWNYGPFPNFNIAGAGISAVPLIGLLVYTLCFWNSGTATGGGTKRTANKEQQKSLLKESQKEDSSGGGRSARSARRRSKTPTKSRPN